MPKGQRKQVRNHVNKPQVCSKLLGDDLVQSMPNRLEIHPAVHLRHSLPNPLAEVLLQDWEAINSRFVVDNLGSAWRCSTQLCKEFGNRGRDRGLGDVLFVVVTKIERDHKSTHITVFLEPPSYLVTCGT